MMTQTGLPTFVLTSSTGNMCARWKESGDFICRWSHIISKMYEVAGKIFSRQKEYYAALFTRKSVAMWRKSLSFHKVKHLTSLNYLMFPPPMEDTAREVWSRILWRVDPLLGRDLETNSETTGVAMQRRGKHTSTTIELLYRLCISVNTTIK
jgi:hypothetical protein